MWNRLSNKGRAGVVLANGSMSSNTSNEGVIRKNMVEGDAVECMVALPGQLFSNTQIPACLWFLSKDKKAGVNGSIDRTGQVLFIDARHSALGRISRTQIEFTNEDLEKLAMLYHRWRGTEFSDGEEYQDVPGLVFSASLDDIKKHDFVLTPGRYVGATEVEDDGEPFAEKMARLTGQLQTQFAESDSLEAEIKKNLGGIGYDF
jgi:type I restriction enzyme M protein